MKPLKIFIGYDPRQALSYNVLQYSISKHSSQPVAITPLIIDQLPITRQGLTPFTFSRFLVPWLCDYEGYALFLDADILVLDDIAKLFGMADPHKAISIVPNEKRFEWASVMLFNCARCKKLTPEFVQVGKRLHTLEFLDPYEIGKLPSHWNHLVGYDPHPAKRPSLIHYTQGVPGFPETRYCEYSEEWLQTAKEVGHIGRWVDIMGNSVHAIQVSQEGGAPQWVPRLVIGEERIAEMMEAQRAT